MRRTLACLAALLALGLAACSDGGTSRSDAPGRLAQVGLLYVTAKVVTASLKRARVAVELSTAAIAALEADELATVEALEAWALERLELDKLEPADRIAAEEVVRIIADELRLHAPLRHDGVTVLEGVDRARAVEILNMVRTVAAGSLVG